MCLSQILSASVLKLKSINLKTPFNDIQPSSDKTIDANFVSKLDLVLPRPDFYHFRQFGAGRKP